MDCDDLYTSFWRMKGGSGVEEVVVGRFRNFLVKDLVGESGFPCRGCYESGKESRGWYGR